MTQFQIETTFSLPEHKEYVLVGNITEGEINKGAEIKNESKKIQNIVGSVEMVDSRNGTFLGLLINYDEIHELQNLKLLVKGDTLMVKNPPLE